MAIIFILLVLFVLKVYIISRIFGEEIRWQTLSDITLLPMYERARRGIGYLPQEASIFRKLTVGENRPNRIIYNLLHIALNHGVRAKDSKHKNITNGSLDIVVNHLLVNRFGFKRERVKDADKYCWIDTVFKDKANQVDHDRHFEYYYNKMMELCPKIEVKVSSGKGQSGSGETVDDDDGLSGKEWEDILKDID
jgi:predicted metal-dependent peptidase